MKTLKQFATILAALLTLAAFTLGQAQNKKAFMFHGKVEKVNAGAGTLTVDGEKVDGWMDAMTMDYKVDNPDVLKKIKPGDHIMATVYEGDMTLHKVDVDKMSSK